MPSEKPLKRGPKPKEPSELRTERMDIPMTAAERRKVERAAAKAKRQPTVWAREVLLREAAK